jgi:hypothetical protein
MRRLALMLMLLVSTPAAACIGPAALHLERLAASGLPTQALEGDAMARALAALRERIDFDEEPTRIVAVFGAQRAAVWLIVDEQLCNILYGPAEDVRAIMQAAGGVES